MKIKLRKIIALTLTFIMLFSIVPIDVLAGLITTDYSDGFGIKSIVNPPVNTHTYTFEADGVTVDTQIVKDGEYLTEPQAPEKEGHRFAGWFVESEQLMFGPTNPITVTQTEAITATARFEQIYYVFFMDSAGATGGNVFRTKSGATGDQVTTGDVKLPIGSTHAVTGWYTNQNLTGSPVGENFTIGTSDQQLWPKIEEGNYVYFISGAQATYIEPQFVPPTGVTQEPAAPTRPGYTFSHWSLTEGGAAYSFGNTINNSITLYAVWAKNTNTPYTVIFWKQSVNDNKNAADAAKTYDFAESVVRYGTTESTVSPTPADGSRNYTGFHYNSGKSVPVVIKGDGSTVLNIYYDRNLLTIKFYKLQSGSWYNSQTMTGLYSQTLAQNGYFWPEENRWTNSSNTNTLTFLDAFIFDTLSAYGPNYQTQIELYARTQQGTARIIHYKEELDGTWTEANTIRTSSGTFYFSDKYPGFTVYQYRADYGIWRSAGTSASYNNLLEVRHKRNSYNLAFYNYNATSRTESILYEGSLSSFYNYTPPRPAGMPTEFVFQGWYKDTAFTEPFNFITETMPFNDLMIYAKWSPPVLDAIIHLSMESGSTTVTFPLVYNEPLDPSILPTVKDSNGNVVWAGDPNNFITMPANREWIGWSTKVNGDYISYNFNTLLTQDIELYPYYVSTERYTVTYNPGGGTGTVVDNKSYAQGAYADVQPGAITPPDSGSQVFLGWTLEGDASGKIYVANERIFIDGNKTLVAAFGPKLHATLTYKPNEGVGSDQVFTFANNTSHTIIENPGYTRDGYQFIGWNSRANGNGISYKPGQTVIVDNTDPDSNVLYAHWEELIPITASKEWDFPVPGIARPAIWFTLYRINADTSETVIGTQLVPDAATGGSVTWEGQLKTNGNGYTYQYYVKETDADGNDYTPPSFTKTENGLFVENKYDYIDFTVTKVWAGDYLPTIKPTIQIQLQVSTNGGGYVNSGAPVILSTPDGELTTSYTWYNLPKQNTQGENLSYRAVEPTPPASYAAEHVHNPDGESTTVTNTYQSTSFKVTKLWADPDNLKDPADADWPEIDLQLYQDGAAYLQYIHVNPWPVSNPDFEHTWNGLPKYKADGTEHVYTVRELAIPVNYIMTVQDGAGASVITNTLSYDSLTATKIWRGDPGPGTSLTLQLYQTAVYAEGGAPVTGHRIAWGEPAVLSAAPWQYTWTGMPQQGNIGGHEVIYEYEVEETVIPSGYYHDAVASASLYVTNVSEKIEFTATKTWDGGINNRPESVTLYLERRPLQEGYVPGTGTPIGEWERVFGTDYALLAAETSHTWTGLDRYQDWVNREVYEYRVREEAVTNYTASYPDNNTVHNQYVIPERTVSVTKEWSGGPNDDHTLPTIRLWRRFMNDNVLDITSQYTPTISPNPALGPSDSFTITYSNLPSTDGDGNILLYGFTEDKVTGYTTTFSNPYTLGGIVYALPESTITNTYDIPMTASLTATKQWVNGPEADHTCVQLTLWRKTESGNIQEVTGKLPGVNPASGTSNSFEYTWSNLESTDFNGNPYTYFFTEDTVPTNYTRTYSNPITIGGKQYAQNNTTVTNSYVPPTDGSATATKQWVNGKASEHEPVTLTLWRSADNGATMEKVTGANPVISPEHGPADTFTYTWSDLQRTDINGVPYQFYFTEDAAALPEGYALSYSASATVGGTEYAPSGATAYNTYTPPTIDVTAVKNWVNGPGSDHVAVPLTLHRKIEGGSLQPVAATYSVNPEGPIADQFTYTWAGVDKTDIDGNAYTYYFKENEVAGYTRSYSNVYETDYGLAGTSVTNTYVQPTGTVEGTKRWVHVHKNTVPDVWMQLWRSTNVNGVGMEKVPDISTIRIGSDTPMTDDPDNLATYIASFSWDNVHKKSPAGEPYYFFVKEVNAAGVDYKPPHFDKLEVGTDVHNFYMASTTYNPPLVTKVLSGRELQRGDFKFEIVQTFGSGTTEHVIETVANGENPEDPVGLVRFNPIPVSALALFYTPTGLIREVIPESPEPGMVYDTTVLKAYLTVTDNGVHDGVLNVAVVYEGDTEFFNLTPDPKLSLTKEGTYVDYNGDEMVNAGDRITYEFTVKNTGNVPISNIAITDANTSVVIETHNIASLAPGGEASVNGYYELTQADIDAGSFTNTATATGEDPDGDPVSASGTDEQSFAPTPKATITKVASPKVFTAPGTVTYTYTVKNTGNVTLTGVAVNDDKLGAVTLDKTTLAPNESATGTLTYDVTQADIDAGTAIKNIAAVTATPSIPETKAEETITITQTPNASITKVASPKNFSAPGTVTYTYTVTNTGNVTLTGVAVNDDKLGAVTLGKTTLAVGESTTGTLTYDVTQADIDAGTAIKNTATVTADQNIPVTKAEETITITQTPNASISKVASPKNFSAPGTVTYTYTVKNTGNVTLTNVKITDDKLGAVTLDKTTLAPNESATGTLTYDVTQADIDAGTAIKNTATVSADQNIPVTKAEETITITQTPNASITKVASPKVFTAPGTVTYTYTMKNTGNVTLTGVAVNDDKLGAVTLDKTTLAPNESATGTLTYDVTQADIDAGTAIKNTATVNADQNIPETKAEETITITQTPNASISKVASPKNFSAPGTVTYTYTVTNTGNVTLTGVAVNDDKLGAVTLDKTTLAVGESATGTLTYDVTQADIDAGTAIKNTATVTADQNIPVTKAEETITITQTPNASITKVASPKNFALPGTVTYTYTVTNTGNVTLTNVEVEDDKLGAVTLDKTTLAVGESATGTLTYDVTQADINAGTAIKNTATVTADQNIPETKAEETITFTQGPAAEITKVADKDVFSAPGTVTYTYTVTNTGNVTLTNVKITDDKLGAVTLDKTTLAPNESATGTLTYDVTQADIDAGTAIKNTATVNADQNIPETKAEETITITQTPNASITKVASPKNFSAPGTVTYTYTVKNTGNVTLTGVKITDDKLGAVTLDKTTLAPNESATGTLTYDVTQADIDAGTAIKNTATVNADQNIPETKAEETITITQTPNASITKVASPKNFSAPGTVTYTYTVKNTGNVTLTGVKITDDKLGAVTLDKTTLAPNESATGTLTYDVTQADIDAGTAIKNTATVTAKQNIPETKAEETITITQTPNASISKVASPKNFSAPGTVTYTYTVKNTGNVTLTGVKITDDKLGAVTLDKTTLAPNESATGTLTYDVTQADIDAGTAIKNTATVNADQNIPETKAEETITITQTPNASITKVASPKNFALPGTVTYTYTVTNTGNVTLTNVEVEDDKLGAVTLDKTTLAVGESATGTLTYDVTQADIDAGTAIKNTATVTADQNIPETKAEETITFTQTPNASITKVASPKNFSAPGTVTYTYTVKNTGNVTLTGVEVEDDRLGFVTPTGGVTIGVGDTATFTKTYDVTQADINAGADITNTATVTAAQDIGEVKAEETVTITQGPAAEITKVADKDVFSAPGTVTYTYTVKNTGNVTLTGVEVEDDRLGFVTPTGGVTIGVGDTATFTKTYDVTQADIDAGTAIKNIATVTAAQDIGETKAEETITITQTPNASISKVASPKNFSAPGTVTYTYTVTNTGNVTLTNVKITDDKLGAVTLDKTTLAPNESATGTLTYDVTQADIDAGTAIKNTATVTATQNIGEVKAEETITITQTPKASISKVASPKNFSAPGTVTYTYTVTNTGNVTLTNVKITDDKLGAVTLDKTTLAPNESATGTLTYDVTQADIDAGTAIKNTATVNADQNIPETKAEETITITQTPNASITKVASPKNFSAPGTVTYTYTVKNTGNVTLTGVKITDDKLGAVTLDKTTLAPNESATGTLTYDVTQADIDAGTAIKNTATVNADQNIPETKAEETITITQTPNASISKVASPKNFSAPGTVTYTYTVKNTGNVTLTGVEVEDDRLDFVTPTGGVTIGVGDTATFTKTYDVTQVDIDKGTAITNTATVTAEQSIPVTQAEETISFTQSPDASITKVANPKDFSAPGTVTYTYTVTNKGNVTLTGVEVEDDRLGFVTPTGGVTIGVGGTATFTKTYDVTQVDIDKGTAITNIATVTAEQSIPVTQASETITITRTPDMTVSKSADKTSYSAVDEVITYTVEVTNTGNISLTGVQFSDSLSGISTPVKTESISTDEILQVGEVWTYTYTYKVTQADLDAGSVANSAKVTTTEVPGGTSSGNTVEADQNPAMKVTKTVEESEFTAVGEMLHYTVVIENTGNITLKNVVVTDSMVALTNAMRTESITPADGILQVGETWTYEYTYRTTQADMDRGYVTNAVKATNPQLPDGDPNNPPPGDEETILGVQDPSASIDKVANIKNFAAPGTVTYTYTVRNTGNVTLTNVAIYDNKLGLVPLNKTTIEVGGSARGTMTYKVTQADIDRGGAIVNTATVTARQNIPVTQTTETVTITQYPGMTVAKRADKDQFTKIGEMIIYTVTVTNTGNVTLDNVVLTDSLVDLGSEKLLTITETKSYNGRLDVGETWIYRYPYLVTREDFIEGSVINAVKATNPLITDSPNKPAPSDELEITIKWVPPPLPTDITSINVGECYE